MKLEIIPMTPDHAPAVADLERVCFQDPWSERMILDELCNPLSLWLTALDGGTVAGYIGSQSVLDEADVMNLAVAPARRREGVGRALMRALTDALRQKGVAALLLEVRPSNEPALSLYRAEGFAEVGRRRNYYLHPKEDALILRKELNHEHPGH